MLVLRTDSAVLHTGSLWYFGEKGFSFPWCSSGKSVDTHEREQTGLCRSPWNGWMGHSGYRREGEGSELPGIVTAALTHQDFNQSGILFIFTLELLDTQGKSLLFFSFFFFFLLIFSLFFPFFFPSPFFFFLLRHVHLKQH